MLSLLSVVTIELLERVEAGLVVAGVGVVVEAAAVVEAVKVKGRNWSNVSICPGVASSFSSFFGIMFTSSPTT